MDLLPALERLRLRRHFAAVLAGLRRAPAPPGCDAPRRAATLHELARYARAGVFPRHGGRGALRPVFVDANGARCAMAHLLEWNGARRAVCGIAATRNHAYVAELARSPAVAAEIRRLGVSEAEAARIQPGYAASPLACLVAFAFQWAGVAAAVILGVSVVRRARARRSGERRKTPRRGGSVLKVALAVLLVGLGVGSHSTTTTSPCPPVPGELVLCGFGDDYSICGSGLSPRNLLRQLRRS